MCQNNSIICNSQEVHGHQPSPVAQETPHLLFGLALQALLLLQVGHQDPVRCK